MEGTTWVKPERRSVLTLTVDGQVATVIILSPGFRVGMGPDNSVIVQRIPGAGSDGESYLRLKRVERLYF